MTPKALSFDVFGTCVDWRRAVARDTAMHVPGVDPLAFAVAWRGQYQPAMERVRTGARGYVALDELHLENLHHVAESFAVTVPDPAALNTAWERLDPWPDVVPGLTVLRRSVPIAPCSNGSIAMMTALARYGGLPWDCILGADIARSYKPKPEVYRACAAVLRLAESDVMMVAAHNADLAAAADAGLATAFVPRRDEHGPGQTVDLRAEGPWTVVAEDFRDLATQLFPDPV